MARQAVRTVGPEPQQPPSDETPYLLSGAPLLIGHGGMSWTLTDRTAAETAAGAVLRFDSTTSDGREWRLIAWAGPADEVVRELALINGRSMRWTLSRFGLDGVQHDIGGTLVIMEAVLRAIKLLDEATSPAVVSANAAGEYCATGGDPRHNVARCPGRHT